MNIWYCYILRNLLWQEPGIQNITIYKHLKSYLICILSNTSEDGSMAWKKLNVHFNIHDFKLNFLICELKKVWLTSDRKGGLFSSLALWQINTTSLEFSSARLMANWKSREVFPLFVHKQRTICLRHDHNCIVWIWQLFTISKTKWSMEKNHHYQPTEPVRRINGSMGPGSMNWVMGKNCSTILYKRIWRWSTAWWNASEKHRISCFLFSSEPYLH